MQWYILQYALENKVDYEDLMLFFAYLKLFFFWNYIYFFDKHCKNGVLSSKQAIFEIIHLT